MQTTLFNQSYQSKIATLLKRGETLTVASVFQKVRTLELRHFISELKKEGMPIQSKWVKSPKGKQYKQYWLNND